MHFESPWAFSLLVVIPLLLVLNKKMGKRGSIRFSSTRHAAKAGISIRQRLSVLPLLLRMLAIILLTVALARPQTGREQFRDISKGIAIQMVVDRSGSMGAEMEYKGQKMNRLEVVKDIFKAFVMGDGHDLCGRPNDLIGMISFARYPDTICPLTLAHGALPLFLNSVRLAQTRAEDGTAIGDALALAAARLKTIDEMLAQQRYGRNEPYEIKSKIIILLSDGENNSGKRDPIRAAELAEKWGIKIYTIATGTGEAVTSIKTPFGVYKVPMGQHVDTAPLKAIAEKTGGLFRKADNATALRGIYEEIDKLEKSEIESVRYIDYKESFLFFALSGLIVIGCEMILNGTMFRKIP